MLSPVERLLLKADCTLQRNVMRHWCMTWKVLELRLNGKVGKVKAMGLDLRRSDTPIPLQEFLSELLLMVLTR